MVVASVWIVLEVLWVVVACYCGILLMLVLYRD